VIGSFFLILREHWRSCSSSSSSSYYDIYYYCYSYELRLRDRL